MATIYLTLSAKTDDNPQKEIRIRFKHGVIDQQAKTSIFIHPEYWDCETKKITIPNFRLMNEQQKELKQYLTDQSEKLNALTANIQTVFNTFDKKNITPDWLKVTIDTYNFPEKYAPKAEVQTIKTLFQFIDKFLKDAPNRKDKSTGRPLTKNSLKQYPISAMFLKEFAKSMKKKDFEFSEIDQKFYDKFVDFLQKKSYAQNNIGKHIKMLKVILNEATRQGYNNERHYNDFHVFMEEVDNVYLNESELQQLMDTDFSESPHLDRVRDWFLLLSWTGSRFSDLDKVAKSDIKDGFISFRQQKTGTKVVIPVHPYILDIFKKYDFNLPDVISNQRFNEYIKEACKIAGITSTETKTRTIGGKVVTIPFEKWEHVTSHTGRRNFATNQYKRGLPTLAIMSITGHKSEKSFLKYIKVKQDEHAEMMKKAWESMYK